MMHFWTPSFAGPIALLLALLGPISSNGGQKHEAETEPSVQSLGFYSRGGLQNPSALDADGVGYIKLFPSRSRQFGSHELIQVISEAARAVSERYPEGERIQVGDLSARQGGKITKHASHQNGLDADLSFYRKNRREQPIDDESGFDEVFVRNGRVTENFDIERNWEFFRSLVRSSQVQRIFVDPAIKRLYCVLFEETRAVALNGIDERFGAAEVLRRLRPYPNHDDHSHIRLYCQTGNEQCVPQEEVVAGTGCSDLRYFNGRRGPHLKELQGAEWMKLRIEHDGE